MPLLDHASKILGNVDDWTGFGQDVVDVTPDSEGRIDVGMIANQEYKGGGFAFDDIATGAGIGSAIAPGIGTAIGAGVGAVSAGAKELFKHHKKNKFEQDRSKAITDALYRNSLIDRRRAVLDNMGTRFNLAYQKFYGR